MILLLDNILRPFDHGGRESIGQINDVPRNGTEKLFPGTWCHPINVENRSIKGGSAVERISEYFYRRLDQYDTEGDLESAERFLLDYKQETKQHGGDVLIAVYRSSLRL